MSMMQTAEIETTEINTANEPAGLDAEHRRFGPGQRDMWYFALFDAFVFSCYLVSYMLFRAKDPESFLASQAHMNQTFGIFNTVLLLTSSWFIARCVRHTRLGDPVRAGRCLVGTALFGIGFMMSKSVEWTLAIRDGYTLMHSEFFTFYYFITGYHMIHMVVGLVALSYIFYNLKNPTQQQVYCVETGATFWHMVDLLWVFIFALLYLMR